MGTHLVDLVPFLLFPDQAVDMGKIHLVAAKRWPTVLPRDQLLRVLGEKSVPATLAARMKDDRLDYYCNTRVDYVLNGLHVRLDVRWDYEAPPGRRRYPLRGGAREPGPGRGATGRRAEVSDRGLPRAQPRGGPAGGAGGRAEARSRPSPRGTPASPWKPRGKSFTSWFPTRIAPGTRPTSPRSRKGFLEYLKDPAAMPPFEKANMLAKYLVTTSGTELSRQGGKP